MEKIVAELAAVIRKKGIGLAEVSTLIGCSSETLFSWLLGFAEPSAFYLGILPGLVDDLSRLYLDAVARKA